MSDLSRYPVAAAAKLILTHYARSRFARRAARNHYSLNEELRNVTAYWLARAAEAPNHTAEAAQ